MGRICCAAFWSKDLTIRSSSSHLWPQAEARKKREKSGSTSADAVHTLFSRQPVWPRRYLPWATLFFFDQCQGGVPLCRSPRVHISTLERRQSSEMSGDIQSWSFGPLQSIVPYAKVRVQSRIMNTCPIDHRFAAKMMTQSLRVCDVMCSAPVPPVETCLPAPGSRTVSPSRRVHVVAIRGRDTPTFCLMQSIICPVMD